MKLSTYPNIHSTITIDGIEMKVSSVFTDGEKKVYKANHGKDRYQFIVFNDLTVSKVHKCRERVA